MSNDIESLARGVMEAAASPPPRQRTSDRIPGRE